MASGGRTRAKPIQAAQVDRVVVNGRGALKETFFKNDLIKTMVVAVRTTLSSGLYAELSFERVGFGKPDVGTICNQPFGR